MLALRMSSIRSIPAISSAETNSPSPPFALSLSLRFPLRPFLRLLKAAYLPCWSFISESRRGMPGGSEEGPSDSRRASLLPFISGACHAPIGPCPAEGAHCAPPLSPHWGRIVHLAADTIRVPLPSLSLQGGAEEGLSPPLLSICNISTFFYPISSIFWVNLKKNLFFLIKSRNFAVGLLLCSMLPRAFARPATRPMGGKSMYYLGHSTCSQFCFTRVCCPHDLWL